MDPRVVGMLVWVGVYPMAALALVLGIRRLRRSRRVEDAVAPTVSVVVSARNEERDLPRCIASLLALDYPAGRLQRLKRPKQPPRDPADRRHLVSHPAIA